MAQPGSFYRIFVYGRDEAEEGGFELHVRSDTERPESRVDSTWRLSCSSFEDLRSILMELEIDGLSRFVREQADGPVFEHVPCTTDDLVASLRQHSWAQHGHVTLIASDTTGEVMRARLGRIEAAGKRVLEFRPA
jgi:hypothetical protein